MQNCDLNSTDVNSATRNLHQKHAHELHSYSQQNIHLSGKALLIVTRKVSQSQAKHRLVMVLVRSKKAYKIIMFCKIYFSSYFIAINTLFIVQSVNSLQLLELSSVPVHWNVSMFPINLNSQFCQRREEANVHVQRQERGRPQAEGLPSRSQNIIINSIFHLLNRFSFNKITPT